MLSSEEKDYLVNIWSDPKHSAAFSGPQKLYKFVKRDGKFKIGLSAINKFLSSVEAYTLQKRVQRNFKRSPILVEGTDVQWDADLMDVRNISKYNQNYQYILVIQDIFSRFIFTVALKNKTAYEIIRVLKSVLNQGRSPQLLKSDKGSEFKNRFLSTYLKEKGIHQIFTENETKSISQKEVFRTYKTDFLACSCTINHTSTLNNCPLLPRLSTTRPHVHWVI